MATALLTSLPIKVEIIVGLMTALGWTLGKSNVDGKSVLLCPHKETEVYVWQRSDGKIEATRWGYCDPLCLMEPDSIWLGPDGWPD